MILNELTPPKAHIWWSKGLRRWMCAVVGGGHCCTGWGISPITAYLSWRRNYYQEGIDIRSSSRDDRY